MGNVFSLNLGIENTSGDFISFLSTSNYYLPNRFDAERELKKNQKADGVYGVVGIHYYSEKTKDKYYHLYKDSLIPGCKICHSKTFIPKKLNKADLFDQFSIDALTVRKDGLLEKIQYLFTSYSMQGVHHRCKVLWTDDKETVSSYADLERNKRFLNWFINLQTLKSLTR
ncbi:hypothetical protein [Chryseobacterium sp. S90]|uniref:hypothetical protein n=1 Tax=Chryseobacterium sp. S90 TaxID=3395373 RepID=UPI0039BC5368